MSRQFVILQEMMRTKCIRTLTLVGSRTPSAEANFVSDPVAASEVLRAGFKNVVLAGTLCTSHTTLNAFRASNIAVVIR
jgi:inosine-uridine nucleoside N-ribohydrolase